MLRLSKKADYALLAMRHLAANADRGPCRRGSWPRPTTCRRNCWPRCCSGWCAARLLTSIQGIRGGYGLARPAAAISVADVIQAIDGPLTVTACSEIEPQLRPVLEVQHPRSALADQGPDRVGAGRRRRLRAWPPTSCRAGPARTARQAGARDASRGKHDHRHGNAPRRRFRS